MITDTIKSIIVILIIFGGGYYSFEYMHPTIIKNVCEIQPPTLKTPQINNPINESMPIKYAKKITNSTGTYTLINNKNGTYRRI